MTMPGRKPFDHPLPAGADKQLVSAASITAAAHATHC